MSKLINQQAITRLSQGLHQKAKDLVEVEKNRALEVEGQISAKVEKNISDIAAINNAETGILKQAKDYVDAAIEGVDAGALEGRIGAVETKNVEQDGEIAKKVAKADVVNGLEETLEGKVLDARQGKVLKDLIDGEVARATSAEGVLAGRLDVVEGNGEGSINKALQDAKTYTDNKVLEVNDSNEALNGKVETLEEQVALVDGKISTAKNEAVESAKTYADTKVQEAKTTLESSINNAYGKIDSNKIELQGNIDALSGRVSINESDIANLKDTVSNKNSNTIVVNTEAEIADANPTPKVGDLAFVISTKRAYIYKGVHAAILSGVPSGWVVFDEITNELDLVDYLKKTDAEATYRKLTEKIAEGDLESGLAAKINEKANQSTLESEIANAKSFATSEAQREAGIVDGKLTSAKAELQGNIDIVDGKVEANKSAIAILNGDASTTGSVDKKIKDALTPYSDTAAVKSMLTNVVGSLTLSIVEDQVVLSAGGVDGVEISKTSLDMITDAEIDNILSGLN